MLETLFLLLCIAAAFLAGSALNERLQDDKADFDAAVEAMERANRRPPVVVVTHRKGE